MDYKYIIRNTQIQVVDWLSERGRGREEEDFLYLWSHFQNISNQNLLVASEELGIVEPPHFTLWSSQVTWPKYLKYTNASSNTNTQIQVTWPKYLSYLDPDRHTVQFWTDASDLSEPSIKAVAEGGFKMVFSNSDGLYLDCGFSGWVWDSPSWCSPYKGWQTVYQNDPHAILETHGVANLEQAQRNILGAEVAMWTEQTDDQSLMAKVGNREIMANHDLQLGTQMIDIIDYHDYQVEPRASALGERLWRGRETGRWREAEPRMVWQRWWRRWWWKIW